MQTLLQDWVQKMTWCSMCKGVLLFVDTTNVPSGGCMHCLDVFVLLVAFLLGWVVASPAPSPVVVASSLLLSSSKSLEPRASTTENSSHTINGLWALKRFLKRYQS